MLASLRDLGKHSAIYGLGTLFGRLLGFVLLPIYTRHLAADEYGVYALLVVTGSVIATIVQSGMGSALFREMVYQGTDRNVAQSTALYYLAAASGVALVLLVPVVAPLSIFIFGDASGALLLYLVFVTVALDLVAVVAMARLRVERQSALFAAVSVARLAITAGVNIVAVAVLEWGVPGLVAANLAVAALFAVAWLVILAPGLRRVFDRPVLGRLLAFGVPLVPFGLGHFVMTYADRYFIGRLLGATEVGQYAVGYTLGMVVGLVVTAVQLAWPAQMFEIARAPDGARQLSRILSYYVAAVGGGTLAVAALAPEVFALLTTPEYAPGQLVVPAVALAYLFYGVMYMTNSGLETRNKVRYMTPTVIVAACLNLALNAWLIPRFGVLGAAWATLASFAVLCLANLVVNLRVWYIRYEYGRLARIGIAMAVVYAACMQVPSGPAWATGTVKVALMAAYPVLLFLMAFFTPAERAQLAAARRLALARVRGLAGAP